MGENVSAVAWTTDGNYLSVGSTSKVYVYSFASENYSYVDDQTLGASEAASADAIVWDQTGNYFAAGIAHTTAAKLRIYNFNGSVITAKDYEDTGADDVTSVDWSQTGSFIAAGTNGSSDQLRVYEYNSSGDTLTEKTKISVGGSVNSVHWNSDATKLLMGRASASGTELRVYSYDSGSSNLTLDREQELTTNINGVRWSNNDAYVACGDSAYNLSVYSFGSGSVPEYSVLLDSVSVVLNNDVSWLMSATVQGECTINGNNKRITLDGDAQISVTTGAQLTLKNIELAGLSGSNISCVDNSASIIMKNCTLLLSDNIEFATGSILFDRDIVLSGTNTFCYASDQTSTIGSNSLLYVDQNVTFSYAPSIANRDLLYLTDKTSGFYLNGCTLYSTATGMRLTRGRLFLDNNVTLSCAGTESSESICFGDGTADNDLDTKLLSGADVTVYGGLCYENVN